MYLVFERLVAINESAEKVDFARSSDSFVFSLYNVTWIVYIYVTGLAKKPKDILNLLNEKLKASKES